MSRNKVLQCGKQGESKYDFSSLMVRQRNTKTQSTTVTRKGQSSMVIATKSELVEVLDTGSYYMLVC